MIDETRSWGIDIPLVVADGGHGSLPPRPGGTPASPMRGGIPTTAHPQDARPHLPPYGGRGPRPQPVYPEPAQTVKRLVIAAGRQAARPVQGQEGSRPCTGRSGLKRMYSRFVALRIRPAGREIRKNTTALNCPCGGCWPNGPPPSQPVQIWLSSLPADTPPATLVRTAKLRWRIEHAYHEMKQALGLTHFEGRTWRGWHTTSPSSPSHTPSAPSSASPAPQKRRRRPEPLPSCPRTAVTPRTLDRRRLPHLSPRHAEPHINLTRHY
ncbi:transposase [Streptomyces sp. NBC_01571]|uniref:transposase n=1 Tax=Streptomyces sp. NBC_01571 TaxID=2975883 RepID=UPI00224FF7AF|nr:transposase [Streptomyces sp. NBC_01571]MCX4580313.1 transposase [Streptomyces sp. NBC_01571]